MVETNLPIIYLREEVLLPFNEIRLEFTLDKDKEILSIAEKYHDSHLLLVNLSDPLEEEPDINNLPKVGVLGKIKSKIVLATGSARVVITGIDRAQIINYVETSTYTSAFVVPTKEYDYNEIEASALRRVLYRK